LRSGAGHGDRESAVAGLTQTGGRARRPAAGDAELPIANVAVVAVGVEQTAVRAMDTTGERQRQDARQSSGPPRVHAGSGIYSLRGLGDKG
jgi:hypothetical protein